MKILKYLGVFLIAIFLLSLLGDKKEDQNVAGPDKSDAPAAIESRTFRLGFTPFPPDLTASALAQAYRVVGEHGDLVAHHFDAGIPWPQALADSDLPEAVRSNWAERKRLAPPGHAVYLALTPLAVSRDKLAPFWITKESEPLTAPWDSYRLNDQNVKRAYLNYVKKAAEFFEPDYLAIGIEVNALGADPSRFEDYLELNAYVYGEIKKIRPDLPVFATIQYDLLRDAEQAKLARKLLEHSDLFAISYYKYGKGARLEAGMFDLAASFGKPVAIAETGAIAAPVTISGGRIDASEEDQRSYFEFLLSEAAERKFLFVVNFVPIDYDALLAKIPAGPAQEMAKAWVHTGLVRPDGTARPALEVWDSYLNSPLSR